MPVIAVVGGQWGDEGKGKIIDSLARRAEVVVRAQGGDNAGHTVVNEQVGSFALHLVPAGIFNPKTTCIIGAGVALNPVFLLEELEALQALKVSTDNLISCLGTTYAGAGTAVVRNIYYVDTANKNLMCRVLVNNLSTDTMANGGTPQIVVPGVSSMSVLYGIAATGSSQVTHYVDVGSVANWTVVKAVRITLNFTSPFGGTDISRTHTINLMN